MLGGDLPLGYEIITSVYTKTTTNQLASMFTTALTKNEQNNKKKKKKKKLIGHKLRHKCMIITLDYVIYALALQML